MKSNKSFKTIFLFLAISTLLSCNKDDQENGNTEKNILEGVWQRSDATANNDYKLYFNPENKGYSTEYIAQPDSTAISNLRPFIWNTIENTLTLDYDDGGSVSTPFSINMEGQLLVPDLSDIPFNKLQ